MTRIEQTFSAIRDVLLYVLLFVTAISYHPTIINMSRIAGYESGTILSRYIVMLFGVVFLLSISISAVRKSSLIRSFFVFIAIITVVALLVQAFYRNSDMIHELRSFAIVFGSIMIGFNLQMNRRKFVFIALVFCITVLFSGIMQVLVNNGGFVIANQYLTDAKNSLGAMLATCCFLSGYLALTFSRRLSKSLAIALSIALFVVMVTIRARMAVLAFALVGLFYLYLLTKNRNIILTVFFGFFVLFFGLLLMPSSFIGYLEDSFTAGAQGEDITSGRWYTYMHAISYLSQHPFLGNILKLNNIGWVHNYPLLKIYQYGLLFSWPILILYLYICFYAYRLAKKTRPRSIPCSGCVCLLIPYLISMAEPTFPFGPGTVTLINFILLGVAEKMNCSQASIKKI